MVGSFPDRKVTWERAFRIIPSRYPPIEVFEDLSVEPAEWELLKDLESRTNPRVRQELGEISLIPVEERISGPNATWVMAPFCHINELGSRFSDGSFGIYYAAERMEGAIKETIFHLERRIRAGHAEPDDLDQRVLVGAIEGDFLDLTADRNAAAPFLDPEDWTEGQKLGSQVRKSGHDGIKYDCVRDPGHLALAVFRPKVIKIPTQERHLRYHWTGERITKYFDFLLDEWVLVP